MKQETKDKLFRAVTIAAMVTPPWNIFWWTVGGIVYAFQGGKKNDASGDGALGMVLAAPITLPLLPFALMKERMELKEYQREQAQYKEAAEWIAAQLRRYGIKVTDVDAAMNGAKVVAEPAPQQEGAYRQVYARAVRHFSDLGLTIDQICGDAEPLRPLDKSWAAEAGGFGAWAEEVFTAPCADCGVEESCGWRFGKVLEMSKTYSANLRHEISLPGGAKRIVRGHICHACLTKLDYKGMTSYEERAPAPDKQ